MLSNLLSKDQSRSASHRGKVRSSCVSAIQELVLPKLTCRGYSNGFTGCAVRSREAMKVQESDWRWCECWSSSMAEALTLRVNPAKEQHLLFQSQLALRIFNQTESVQNELYRQPR